MRRERRVRWLQLSDLHIFRSTAWEIMLQSYVELSEVFKPDFIVVTGDYCHKRDNKTYDDALTFLNELANIFSLDKANFFFVPGNHDASNFKTRKEKIATIRSAIENNPDCYLEYNKDLQKGFKAYCNFVRKFYGSSLSADDERIKNPSDTYVVPWENRLNIVALNTALISNGDRAGCEIVDIEKVVQIANQIDKSKPTIVLAHHAPNALADSQRVQLERQLEKMKARVYLCGDEHKIERVATIANKYDIGNQTVGITCGKSAVEQGDTYSDVCVIGYTWEGGRTNVNVFKWLGKDDNSPYQFIKSDTWYHHIDKPFSFKMKDNADPFPSDTERIETAWEDFLTYFKREDRLINQKLGQNQIKNKSGNTEPFDSEKIMRSLIMIGIPFPAVSEITQKTIDAILGMVPLNVSEWVLDTKTIRLKVLEAIRAIDGVKWSTDKVGGWCTKYIRRYGHNNRIIKFCNVPKRLNTGSDVNDASYKFIKEVFLPDVFQTVCPSFDIKKITNSQKTNLADEVISFINECDLYMIDYEVIKAMVREIITKPPHPWIIGDQQREELVKYDRNSVESNLKEIERCKIENRDIPLAVFIELLHHTAAMMLDRYFNFCGCVDLESFNILITCFKDLFDARVNPQKWDFSNESKEIQRLCEDFERHNINISDYYDKLRAVNPQNVQMSNTERYVSAITTFAEDSLRIIDCLNANR